MAKKQLKNNNLSVDSNVILSSNLKTEQGKKTKQPPTAKNKKNSNESEQIPLQKAQIKYPLWFSISEAAKLGGVNQKTLRRALQKGDIPFKIYKNRYILTLSALITFLHSTKKLRNKLKFSGLGQYIKKWRE